MKNNVYFAISFFLLSCGNNTTEPNTTSTSASNQTREFIPLEKSELKKLKNGINKGIKICNCYKTKSTDFSNVYAVACRVKGGNIATGLWAMGGNSGIFSIGFPTATVSDWGMHPDIVKEDDGFQEAIDFVNKKEDCE